jgi:hypothetical protein
LQSKPRFALALVLRAGIGMGSSDGASRTVTIFVGCASLRFRLGPTVRGAADFREDLDLRGVQTVISLYTVFHRAGIAMGSSDCASQTGPIFGGRDSCGIHFQ